MKLKSLFLLYTLYFVFIQFVNGQDYQFTKGDNNISAITLSDASTAMCSVVEYPEFLVLIDVPYIPIQQKDSIRVAEEHYNPLIPFIDSIYNNKPIKYILNTHSHGHSLSTAISFLKNGTQIVTAKENIEIFDKRGLFGEKTSKGYAELIIPISSDTTLLAETNNPIEVLYLKKSDYKSIPTKTFLFFNFPEQKLLATSCMVYLTNINEKYGYKGLVYSDRLIDANKIIADKNLNVEHTIQLHKLKMENGVEKPAIYPISHLKNVLEHSWHRQALSEHFQNMSHEELTTKTDSLLNFLVENNIYHIIVNHAVYELMGKEEHAKAVALAQLQLSYRPDNTDLIDSLGEAYYNNGQIDLAIHYDKIIQKIEPEDDGLGIAVWEQNKKDRQKNVN